MSQYNPFPKTESRILILKPIFVLYACSANGWHLRPREESLIGEFVASYPLLQQPWPCIMSRMSFCIDLLKKLGCSQKRYNFERWKNLSQILLLHQIMITISCWHQQQILFTLFLVSPVQTFVLECIAGMWCKNECSLIKTKLNIKYLRKPTQL